MSSFTDALERQQKVNGILHDLKLRFPGVDEKSLWRIANDIVNEILPPPAKIDPTERLEYKRELNTEIRDALLEVLPDTSVGFRAKYAEQMVDELFPPDDFEVEVREKTESLRKSFGGMMNPKSIIQPIARLDPNELIKQHADALVEQYPNLPFPVAGKFAFDVYVSIHGQPVSIKEDKSDLHQSQQMPIQGKEDVVPHVIKDLHLRSDVGLETYGTRLQTHNGRNVLQDAYEEALDMACYLKQAILEGK